MIPSGVTDPKLYKAALGLERQLLAQLTKPLASTMPPQAADALTDAITEGGGVGFAKQLYEAMQK